MIDADRQRVWMGDLPVRDIQDSIASLEAHPHAGRMSREQKVSLTYAAAIARVLSEQSELYLWALAALEGDGASSAELREEALDQARIIAELWLSARREHVDITEHAPPGLEPLAALLALEAIKSCDVVLAGEDPDPALLLSDDQVDALLHNPLMDAWWERALPRTEEPPSRFGSGEPPPPEPTDRELARAMVVLLADCVESSALDYHALVNGDSAAVDEASLRSGALQRALEITRTTHANFVLDVDFSVLGEALDPLPAGIVLKAIADSCIVYAAPNGDFERYGLTPAEFDELLAAPALRAWLDAVEELT